MIIKLKYSNEAEGKNELVLIELQGELQFDEEEESILKIGDLKTTNSVDYTLEISNKQRLFGKRVKLTKPLAIIFQDQDLNLQISSRLITEKILFNTRPMAII